MQVSLSDAIQIAQMRSSIALALASSGAILSALNRVSRLNVDLPRPGCGGLEADGQSRGLCAKAGKTSGDSASAAATTRTGNRGLMPAKSILPRRRGKRENNRRVAVRLAPSPHWGEGVPGS